jgi:ADP-ribosylglycohydrolase
MYGAILGDMIGAHYEFGRSPKAKDFPLFSIGSHYTDDSVMTIAVADVLLSLEQDADDNTVLHHAVSKAMRTWGRKYPNAGYGGRFHDWLYTHWQPKPYNSWGNGSAMRVSSVGWLFDSIEETRRFAKLTAEVTHNHPEAITAFLEGTDFEDVIRTAVSLSGDCDTLTCIAGAMAEAFYGVPDEM